MRTLILKFMLLSALILGTAPSAFADRQIIVRDPYFFRQGQDTVSGTIYNVKRRDLRIETAQGKVEIDMTMIDFRDRLNEIFTEGMHVTAEGVYKDRDEFTAYEISFVKGKKRYTYRSKTSVPYQRLYKKIR